MSEKPLVLSSSSEDESGDDLVQAIHKQNQRRYNVETAVEVNEEDYSDGSMPSKTKNVIPIPTAGDNKLLKKSSSSNDILSPNQNGKLLWQRLSISITTSI